MRVLYLFGKKYPTVHVYDAPSTKESKKSET